MPASPRAARRSWVWLLSIRSPSCWSVVVAAAPDVAVLDGIGVGGGVGKESLVEAGLEDRGDRPIARCADADTTAACGLETLRPIGPLHPQDTETGSEALLRMGLCPHDRLAQRDRGRTDLLGGGQQTRRRPEGVSAMRARHVLWDCRVPALQARACVAGDAGAAMEYLDGGLGGPHLDDLADQAGWHRVEVSLNFDVVIRRHARAAPFGVLIGLGRQQHQGRTIDGVEELTAAGTELAHQAGIEAVDQDADRDVQLGEREETPIAQPRQNPSLNDENRRLDLGLVARLARPRRHDGGAVMGREILVGPVDPRLVAARRRD